MKNRYKRTFEFFNDEKQAQTFCDRENLNSYIKKNHKAYYLPWTSEDKTENKFIAWYVTK